MVLGLVIMRRFPQAFTSPESELDFPLLGLIIKRCYSWRVLHLSSWLVISLSVFTKNRPEDSAKGCLRPGDGTSHVISLLKMFDGSSANEHGNHTPSPSPHPNDFPASEHGKETSSVSPNDNMFPKAALQKSNTPPSALQQNLFMVFITLTQLVQMIPLGAGINSGLAIGEALGATHIESVWIVASYPLTQGAFVLIGKC